MDVSRGRETTAMHAREAVGSYKVLAHVERFGYVFDPVENSTKTAQGMEAIITLVLFLFS
jgi:hypothetical protein